LGGERGRLIKVSDRSLAVELIEEAKAAGARIFKACEVLEISVRTFKRWKAGNTQDRRKGAAKVVKKRLSDDERALIVNICCKKEYQDLTPYEIYVILLDIKIYVGSISSFYRVLRQHDLIHFRGNTRKGTKTKRPPERIATGPNQVWSWDITYLHSPVAGQYFYLYTVIDIWSKLIVGWQIETVENANTAQQMFTRIMKQRNLSGVYLHSDNGNAMKAGTMLMTLYKLGIIPSRSRPRVSNDNPYIESFFRTLKYMKSYPQYFDSIENARYWTADFIDWYNTRHLHTSIGYVTPAQKHAGEADAIISARNEVKKMAYDKNPIRWSGGFIELPNPKIVILNPSLLTLHERAS